MKAEKCKIIFKNINKEKLFSHQIFDDIFDALKLHKIHNKVAIQTTILQT